MAITHTTFGPHWYNNNSTFQPIFRNVLQSILDSYDWNGNSNITGDLDVNGFCKGSFYFTEQSYIEISTYSSSPRFRISLVTPKGTRQVFTSTDDGETAKYSIGKTSKGLALLIYGGTSSEVRSREYHNYNLYIGEITQADGTVTKGCFYAAGGNDNTYTVATDEGFSSEATFNSVIDSTRKGYLIPVTDSTFGGVFKDVYMMACAPVQYNKFKIADTEKKYLCGKAFCLED